MRKRSCERHVTARTLPGNGFAALTRRLNAHRSKPSAAPCEAASQHIRYRAGEVTQLHNFYFYFVCRSIKLRYCFAQFDGKERSAHGPICIFCK